MCFSRMLWDAASLLYFLNVMSFLYWFATRTYLEMAILRKSKKLALKT